MSCANYWEWMQRSLQVLAFPSADSRSEVDAVISIAMVSSVLFSLCSNRTTTYNFLKDERCSFYLKLNKCHRMGVGLLWRKGSSMFHRSSSSCSLADCSTGRAVSYENVLHDGSYSICNTGKWWNPGECAPFQSGDVGYSVVCIQMYNLSRCKEIWSHKFCAK